MTFNSLVLPLALVLGSLGREPWWLASLMMFFVALVGPHCGTAFLIETSIPAELGETIELAMLYAAGGLWTIGHACLLARASLQPTQQEVAAFWEETTALIPATRAAEEDTSSVVGRHRRERALANSHQALREAVERARGALGTARAELSGPSEELERACRSVAAWVLAGRRQFSLTLMRAWLIELTSAFGRNTSGSHDLYASHASSRERGRGHRPPPRSRATILWCSAAFPARIPAATSSPPFVLSSAQLSSACGRLSFDMRFALP
jgi:hypothetical protein